VLTFPTSVAAEPELQEAIDEGLYDMAEEPSVAKPVGGKCPSCGAKVPPASVLCVICGLNFKTGKTLRTQQMVEGQQPKGRGAMNKSAKKPASPPALPAARAITPGNRIPGAPMVGAKKIDYHAAQSRKQFIMIASIIAGLALLVGGSIAALKFLGDSTDGGSAMQILGEDAEAKRLIDEDAGTEAKEWITADPARRMLGYFNEKQALAKFDQWYALGAKKVYCSGAAICLTAVIELPAEADKRKALFDWAKEWHSRQRRQPVDDVGQRYLLISVPMAAPM